MSVEAMAIAMRHSRATGSAKLVLVGIASHDGDGGAWPSLETLATYGNCTVRNAQRALAKLVQLGEIRVFQQAGGTTSTPDHRRPNLYEFLLKCPSTCDRSRNHKTRPELPLTPASPGDADVTPTPGTSVTPPPDAGVTRTIPRNTQGTEKASAVSARATVQPAPKYPRFEDMPKYNKLHRQPDEQIALNERARVLRCPKGFGDAAGSLHLIPATLTGCARCGREAIDILADEEGKQ